MTNFFLFPALDTCCFRWRTLGKSAYMIFQVRILKAHKGLNAPGPNTYS